MNGKHRVLVVDDAPENIRILTEALKDAYTVIAATSGEKALELAARSPGPDLVLLDVVMPGMDGYEVCERLAADAATARIPVIFVTSLTQAGDEARGLALGAVDYITKPFNARLVEARVRNQIELKQYRDQLEVTVAARTRELLDATAAKEKLEGELHVARSLQRAMLPRERCAAPGGEYEVYAALEPAKAVGGDLFDYFLVDGDRLCVLVGDVSDKGVPAALFMVKASTLLRTEARRAPTPEVVLDLVNRELCRENDECMFVTLVLAVLDLASGRAAIARAGHDAPLLLSGGYAGYLELPPAPPLGIRDDARFAPSAVQLAPGDGLLLYTDGITEAFNPAGEPFGDLRLLEAALARSDRDASALGTAVHEAVVGFVGAAPQSDDITLLALRYRGGD